MLMLHINIFDEFRDVIDAEYLAETHLFIFKPYYYQLSTYNECNIIHIQATPLFLRQMKPITKLYPCNKCGESFKRKDTLTKHLNKQKTCVTIIEKAIVPTITPPVSEIELLRKEISELREEFKRLLLFVESRPISPNVINISESQIITATTVNYNIAAQKIAQAELQMDDNDMTVNISDPSMLIPQNGMSKVRKIILDNYYNADQSYTTLANLTSEVYFAKTSYKNYCMYLREEDNDYARIRVGESWGTTRNTPGVYLKVVRSTEKLIKTMYNRASTLQPEEIAPKEQFLKDLADPEYIAKTIDDIRRLAKDQSTYIREYDEWGIIPKVIIPKC